MPAPLTSGELEAGEVPTTARLAGLVTAALLMLAVLAYIWPTKPVTLSQAFTPEHVDFLAMADSTRPRRAHKVLVIAVLAVVIGGRALRKRLLNSARFLRAAALAEHWFVRGAGVAILGWAARTHDHAILKTLAAILFGWALLVALSRRVEASRALGLAVGAAVMWYGVLVVARPIARVPDLSSLPLKSLTMIEWHFGIVVSQGDRLAQGLRLFRDIVPHYGVLLPTVLGLCERATGLLTMGEHIHAVQVMQLVFAILVAVVYLVWSRGNLVAAALSFLLVVPWLQTSFGGYNGVLFPNQSAWRSLGFPIGALLLLAGPRLGAQRFARLAGLGWGVMFLCNPETATAVGAGFALFLWLRLRAEAAPLRLSARAVAEMAIGAAVVLIIFGLIFRRAFGYLPLPDFGAAGRSTFSRFAGGYGGIDLPIRTGITWMVMLGHATFEVVRAGVARGRLGRRGEVRAALAAIIIVWFAYYFNRAHPWNLWTFYFLYGFFVIDTLTPPALAAARRAVLRHGIFPARAAAAVVVFAAIIPVHRDAMEHMAATPPAAGARELSGVTLPGSAADLIERKASFIAEQAKDGPVTYFTIDSYLVPMLSNVFPALPAADVFSETFTPADFDYLVARVKASHPERLLFDDPMTPLSGTGAQRQFYERLRQSLLGGYVPAGSQSGWEIWQRATTGDAGPTGTPSG
jgi:hypothetical protein